MSDKWIRTIAILIFFLCLYSLTSAGDFYSSDGEVMYQTTGAFADHGSIALAPNPALPQIIRAANGDWVSKYDPGLPLVGVIFYQAGSFIAAHTNQDRFKWTHLMVALMPGVCMAIALTALYALAARFDQHHALILTLTAGLATIAWPYSRVLFAESLLSALLILSLWSPEPLLSGLFLGAAITTRASAVIYLPALLWYTLRSGSADNRLSRCVRFFIGVLPGIVIVLTHNYLRFGSPFIVGYTNENFTTPPITGIYGLLLSSGKGVFWYSPPLILAVLLWFRFRRIAPALAWTLLLLAISALILYGTWAVWDGGWNWGPRYLVPLVMLWMLPLLALPRDKNRWIALFILTLLLGVAIQWVAVRANSNDHYAAVGFDSSPQQRDRVLFDPGLSPIPAQFGLYFSGQTVPLVMSQLALPVPTLLIGSLILSSYRLVSALAERAERSNR